MSYKLNNKRELAWIEMQKRGRKPTETFVTEICFKSLHLYLEGLKNIKIILFIIQELLI